MNASEKKELPGHEQSPNTAEKILKPCCACPQTKKLRDKCIMENGEQKCLEFIDAHKECLRSKGFIVD